MNSTYVCLLGCTLTKKEHSGELFKGHLGNTKYHVQHSKQHTKKLLKLCKTSQENFDYCQIQANEYDSLNKDFMNESKKYEELILKSRARIKNMRPDWQTQIDEINLKLEDLQLKLIKGNDNAAKDNNDNTAKDNNNIELIYPSGLEWIDNGMYPDRNINWDEFRDVINNIRDATEKVKKLIEIIYSQERFKNVRTYPYLLKRNQCLRKIYNKDNDKWICVDMNDWLLKILKQHIKYISSENI